MSNSSLKETQGQFEMLLDALRRLETLGGAGDGHAVDIAKVLAPLAFVLRGVFESLSSITESQSVESSFHLDTSKFGKPISIIRRDIELGLEALEGLQEIADSSDGTAKAVSKIMVPIIFQLEMVKNNLDDAIPPDGEGMPRGRVLSIV